MSDHHFWLSEEQFARLQPLLPNKPRGVPRVDDRRVISGIVDVLKPDAGVRTRRSTMAHPRRRTSGSSAGGETETGSILGVGYGWRSTEQGLAEQHAHYGTSPNAGRHLPRNRSDCCSHSLPVIRPDPKTSPWREPVIRRCHHPRPSAYPYYWRDARDCSEPPTRRRA